MDGFQKEHLLSATSSSTSLFGASFVGCSQTFRDSVAHHTGVRMFLNNKNKKAVELLS